MGVNWQARPASSIYVVKQTMTGGVCTRDIGYRMVSSGAHVKVDVIGWMRNGYGGQQMAESIGLKIISYGDRRMVVSSGSKTITFTART